MRAEERSNRRPRKSVPIRSQYREKPGFSDYGQMEMFLAMLLTFAAGILFSLGIVELLLAEIVMAFLFLTLGAVIAVLSIVPASILQYRIKYRG